ncbi:YkgJ family cysteine cluster protein [Tichowtungia aerotolerans]|uniref:YkgJ family cysteine cluster protein n=1 Tax=Tichowtungia aerotolerans TaxID=2697043 RepID=A0A6P1M238_9BACT|nr:YkgJ family cysteine cluster protein [Tichowtungia aerotolerans]QHI68889.1 YkgJ family cysteine cluster protein [Tichowtungia aerotolerans]
MTAETTERSFICQRCGTCCRWPGHVLLTDGDISRMAAATGLSEEDFIEQYTVLASNRRQLSLTEYEDGRCVFLTDEGCAFYDARPEQCRNFPHTWRVAEGCPALEAMDKSTLKR